VYNLQPAAYAVIITQPGFKKFESADIVLTASTSASVGQVALEVGIIRREGLYI
jgi:hypothetical protein